MDPLSPKDANLFLKFARWFDSQGMDKGVDDGLGVVLDTPRNGEAALAWARTHGVLGLGKNRNSTFSVGGGLVPSSTEIAARLLGVPHLGHSGTRAYRMSAEGGEDETVEKFVWEACEANAILKLYAAATAKTFNMPDIERFMSSERATYAYPPGRSPSYATHTERERFSQDEELTRSWALRVVEETVNRKVEKDVYPILLGEGGAYVEGWGFKSLLGAMWLQMRMFMLGDKTYAQCPQCNEPFHKSRRDKTYCSNRCANQASSARSYEREKERQEKARKVAKRKLRGNGRD